MRSIPLTIFFSIYANLNSYHVSYNTEANHTGIFESSTVKDLLFLLNKSAIPKKGITNFKKMFLQKSYNVQNSLKLKFIILSLNNERQDYIEGYFCCCYF